VPLSLRFDDVVSGGEPFHAAMVALTAGHRSPSGRHTHSDFYELVYTLGGTGRQLLPGGAMPMRTGFLAFIRPHDEHEFIVAGSGNLQFINLAFPAATWRSFAALADLTDTAAWDRALLPPHTLLDTQTADHLAAVFQHALHRYVDAPTTLDLFAALTATIPALQAAHDPDRTDEAPAWLKSACTAMRDEENLRQGLARFRALASVSPGHLARATARYLHCTPVQYLTERRLARARFLLASTTEPITSIAYRCGFSSPSYFTSQFHARYRTSPRNYRTAARQAIVP
jgi:AraC family cel operon transcriptional repressor